MLATVDYILFFFSKKISLYIPHHSWDGRITNLAFSNAVSTKTNINYAYV